MQVGPEWKETSYQLLAIPLTLTPLLFPLGQGTRTSNPLLLTCHASHISQWSSPPWVHAWEMVILLWDGEEWQASGSQDLLLFYITLWLLWGSCRHTDLGSEQRVGWQRAAGKIKETCPYTAIPRKGEASWECSLLSVFFFLFLFPHPQPPL